MFPLSVNSFGSSVNETEVWPPAVLIVAGRMAKVSPTPPVIISRFSRVSAASDGDRGRRGLGFDGFIVRPSLAGCIEK